MAESLIQFGIIGCADRRQYIAHKVHSCVSFAADPDIMGHYHPVRTLNFKDKRVATFNCPFLSNLTMDLTIMGTNGTLHLHDFVHPFRGYEASFPMNSKPRFTDINFHDLVASIKNGAKLENMLPTHSWKTQLIVDAVKASIKKGYEPVQMQGLSNFYHVLLSFIAYSSIECTYLVLCVSYCLTWNK
ncbi:hypothetical protein ACFE04_007727 [Oxalis oulophora]